MQKLLTALVAVLSFCAMYARPMLAQDQTAPSVGQDQSETPKEAGNRKPYDASEKMAVVVPPGATWENVDVKDRPLIIQGDIKGSVKAVNSDVTLLPGARIEGGLNITKGSLTVGRISSPTLSSSVRSVFHQPATPSKMEHPQAKTGNWFGGQFCLWLLGLSAGVVVLLTAPRATSRIAETIEQQPGSSLAVGGITAAAMFAALAVSGIIMSTKSLFSLLWMPFLVVIVLSSLFLLIVGWLAGMRFVGDKLAQRFGNTGIGTLYGRMALGLTAFFVADALLGGINSSLGAVGLLAEFAVTITGIGALVKTGFGRDPDWLFTRLRRASDRYSSTPKI